ncbi:hypothetical protein ACFE04_022426 [Oxalis oulophora]
MTVEAVKGIANKLNISQWKKVTTSACIDGSLNNMVPTQTEEYDSETGTDPNRVLQANCTCSYEGDLCHITSISMIRMNFKGEIPDEFENLTFLQRLKYAFSQNSVAKLMFANVSSDLTRNYLSGTIPTFLARLPLIQLVTMGNRLTGSIPEELGNLSTLQELNVEDNLLGGPLPASLGNLSLLYRLVLTANNFTGQIPESFGKLKNLEQFRTDGNTFSGQLPSFIGNWTKLKALNMQGTSMEGPIPPTLSLLKNLTELRITDLNGSSSKFPDLSNLISLEVLVLRNCLITGSIPDYIGDMKSLKTLDLSFNQLSGVIPTTIQTLEKLVNVFLTNNSLTGAIPDKLSAPLYNMKIDLSYNNFTEIASVLSSCQPTTTNLASSYSSNDNKISWCMKKGLPCSQKPKYHSLFINCGGLRVKYENEDYLEDDSQNGNGASYFFSDSLERWAFSSTGVFPGNDNSNSTTTNDPSRIVTGPELYQSARVAATSLKYYGLCMIKGNYKLKLQFAEIMYTDDQTYKSLGRRLFDVYIQGKRYLKDFNIAKEAGGVGKIITEEYNVDVNETTLEIHLYWAGKGTTSLPERGDYGPLISAISVTPNFPVDTGGMGLSGGAIAGIVISLFVVTSLILLLFLRKKGYLWRKDVRNSELGGLKTGYFSLKTIKAATNNFDSANKIGEGGFGPVYKGIMSDGVTVAVKQLSSKSKQGNREFVNEIGMISALQHPNLVKLYGCCIEGNQLLLIYEYLENNSLARALFEEGNILELVDPSLESKYTEEEAIMLLNISLLCTNPSANLRPQMSSVVSMIEGNIPIEASEVQMQSKTIGGTMKGLEMISTFSNDSEVKKIMADGPWESPSTSKENDLYPVHFD